MKEITFKTKYVDIKCSSQGSKNVSVLIKRPSEIKNIIIKKKLDAILESDFFLLNVGNNHLGISMNSIEKVDLNELYYKLIKLIKSLEINLSIFSISDKFVKIRTFENGVGETLSCGSASLCVATHVMCKENKVNVSSIGGKLKFRNHRDGILMSGPSNFIYKGNIDG